MPDENYKKRLEDGKIVLVDIQFYGDFHGDIKIVVYEENGEQIGEVEFPAAAMIDCLMTHYFEPRSEEILTETARKVAKKVAKEFREGDGD